MMKRLFGLKMAEPEFNVDKINEKIMLFNLIEVLINPITAATI